MMTGGADYLLALLLEDVAAFQRTVVKRIASISGVSRLSTSFAVKTVFERDAPAALLTKNGASR